MARAEKDKISHYNNSMACNIGGTEELITKQQIPTVSYFDSNFLKDLVNNNPKRLTPEDITEAANMINADIHSINALIEVEATSSGFYSDGRPIILFEGHKFWSELRKIGLDPSDYLKGNEDILYPRWTSKNYTGTAKGEYDRLSRAINIDKDSAMKSTSWGMFQIMGFHYENIGYKDINVFIDDMFMSEGKQLLLTIKLLEYEGIAKYLAAHDWEQFARKYNGPNYKTGQYHIKLKNTYEKSLVENK